MMKRDFLRYLELHKGRVKSLLSDLIAIPTVNPPGENYEGMVDLLEARCRHLGLRTKRFITPKRVLEKFNIKGGSKRISLVADWSVRAGKIFHINSHYDVVPATDKWKTDPFRAVVRGNRIYGRGSEDMKGNIASVLFALEAIRKCKIRPKVNIQISFTPDEEIGGGTGLGYLMQKNIVKADYVMSEGYSGDYVSIGNKGVLWGEVTIKGKAAHASIPHRGVNSFERMVELAAELNKLKNRISRRKTRYYMREAVSRSPSLVMGGLVEGGLKANVVPGMTKFSIDRRLIPEEEVDAAKMEIKEIVDRFNRRYRDSRVDVKFIAQGLPSISRKDDGFFEIVSDAIFTVIGRRPKFCIMPGATDMRYFMWKGVPALGYSARGGESWHSDNEFVYIDSLVDTAKVYAMVMSRIG